MKTLISTSILGCTIAVAGMFTTDVLAAQNSQSLTYSSEPILVAVDYPDDDSELGRKINDLLQDLETEIDQLLDSIDNTSLEDIVDDRIRSLRNEVDNLHDSFRSRNRSRDRIDDDLEAVLELRESLQGSVNSWRRDRNGRREQEILEQWQDVNRRIFVVEFLLTD